MIIPELPERLGTNTITYNIEQVTISISQIYEVQEPILTNEEEHMYGLIRQGLFEVLNIDTNAEENIEEYLNNCLQLIISELSIRINQEFMQKVLYKTHKELISLGKIHPLILDPLIKKINITLDKPIEVEHQRYQALKTNITFNQEDYNFMIRKLSLLCNQPIDQLKSCKYKNLQINITNNEIQITKDYSKLPSPISLINNKQCSPEMLAYLWILIENKKDIYIDNEIFLNSLAYFVPPHAKIATNIPDFIPLIYEETRLNENKNQEYSFFINPKEKLNGIKILCQQLPEKEIICETSNNIMTAIKEDGREILIQHNDKFYHNLANSKFIKSKGNTNIIEQELNLRTRLILTLARFNINSNDFRKIIAIYYDNPTAVLQKARVI